MTSAARSPRVARTREYIAQAHRANITAHPRSGGGLDIEFSFASPKNSTTAP
jgi:hypothetical protein